MKELDVLINKEGKTCTITLNQPTTMNALNSSMIDNLLQAFQTIRYDKEIRVVILTGTGGNFCSGGDMTLLDKGASPYGYLGLMKRVKELVSTIREIPQPIVTKLNGVAIGGGANLALTGDFVIAAHGARFCEVFVNIGAILDVGGTYFLPRLVGLPKARELALLGEDIDGKTASSIGLIYKSVPDETLDQEVVALVDKLAEKSPAAVALIKEGLEKSLDMTLNEALDWEAAHQSIILNTVEHKQAVKKWFARKQ
jgi:2-(1,2-epoxy-1,2-dihydrophenyl)acetyl-CoA isomerase